MRVRVPAPPERDSEEEARHAQPQEDTGETP